MEPPVVVMDAAELTVPVHDGGKLSATKELKNVSQGELNTDGLLADFASLRLREETSSLRPRRNTRRNGLNMASSMQMHLVSKIFRSIPRHPLQCTKSIPNSSESWHILT